MKPLIQSQAPNQEVSSEMPNFNAQAYKMTTLTPIPQLGTIPQSNQKGGWISMNGGIYFDKRRGTFHVWFPWKGKRLWFHHYGANKIPLSTKDLAQRVLASIRSEVDKGIFDPILWGKDKTILVPNAWKTYQEQSQVGMARMKDRDRIFEDFIKPYFKEMTLAEIEEHHIMDWFSKLVGASRDIRQSLRGALNLRALPGHRMSDLDPDHFSSYSPSYLRLIRVTLRAFLNFFQITRKKMMKFPAITVSKKKLLWLSEEEQRKVIGAALSHHQPILRFMCTYGVRASEACGLQRTDIDWEKREITLRGRKNSEDNVLPIMPEIEKDLVGARLLDGEVSGLSEPIGQQIGVGAPLNNAQVKNVVLRPDLTPTARLKGQSTPTNLHYVFSTQRGQPYTRQLLYSIWVRASKKAGIRIIPLKNGTRTSLACRLKNHGTSTGDIARILGNSEQVVEESYARVTTQRVAEVLELRKAENESV